MGQRIIIVKKKRVIIIKKSPAIDGLWCEGTVGGIRRHDRRKVDAVKIRYDRGMNKLVDRCVDCDNAYQNQLATTQENNTTMKKTNGKKKSNLVRESLKGKNYGLNISQTWEKLLHENEKRTWHKTDEEISKLIQKEFPGRDSALLTDPANVRKIRSLYNRDGLKVKRSFSKGVESFTYDKDGNQVEKHGRINEKGIAVAVANEEDKPPKKKVVVIKRKK